MGVWVDILIKGILNGQSISKGDSDHHHSIKIESGFQIKGIIYPYIGSIFVNS